MIRDEEGQLTNYKSGDRFLFVEPFEPPLPKQQKIGTFHCTVLYHGKTFTCHSCGECGHKAGDSKCKAKPKKTIYAFKGYTHPLSNHFPCNLKLYGKDFKSVEHVLYWRMALELGNDELAKEIHNARHAGEAKRLGKNIADEETRWNCEEKNVDFMNNLLEAKAEQCPEFRQCLLESATKILAEANPSKFWATGMSAYLTEHTDPDFCPGHNQLGTLLMNLATHLLKNSSDNMQP